MTRFSYVMTAYLAIASLVITGFIRPAARLVWNASESIPVGLYHAHPGAAPKAGDLVAVRLPKPLESFLAHRHYLPLRVPLLKPVTATAGQTVCRSGYRILVDGKHLGDALQKDRHGRPMPLWAGCRRLGADQIFLMNGAVRDSLDGRYFGPLPVATIRGTLTPLWVSQPTAQH